MPGRRQALTIQRGLLDLLHGVDTRVSLLTCIGSGTRVPSRMGQGRGGKLTMQLSNIGPRAIMQPVNSYNQN